MALHKVLFTRRVLAQRRKVAKRYRVSNGFLCDFAPLREKILSQRHEPGGPNTCQRTAGGGVLNSEKVLFYSEIPKLLMIGVTHEDSAARQYADA